MEDISLIIQGPKNIIHENTMKLEAANYPKTPKIYTTVTILNVIIYHRRVKRDGTQELPLHIKLTHVKQKKGHTQIPHHTARPFNNYDLLIYQTTIFTEHLTAFSHPKHNSPASQGTCTPQQTDTSSETHGTQTSFLTSRKIIYIMTYRKDVVLKEN